MNAPTSQSPETLCAIKMTAEDIIEHKNEIVRCAEAFRCDANYLMTELSTDFNFSLAEGLGFPKDIYGHKYNNQGIFRKEWAYYFHGSHCRFENLTTGQVVELNYTMRPEFGYLSGFFFYNYMATTERFRDLAEWFKSDTNVYTAIDLLADMGILTKVTSLTLNYIIAL